MEKINAVAPAGSSAAAPSGTLAKLLQWHLYEPIEAGVGGEVLMHQADFCVYILLGGFELDKKTGSSKVSRSHEGLIGTHGLQTCYRKEWWADFKDCIMNITRYANCFR